MVQAYCILLCFSATAFFTNWNSRVTLGQVSLPASAFQQQLLNSCLCVTFWYFLQYFKLFLLLLYLLWWLVIIDLWCFYKDLLKAQMMVLFSNEVFIIRAHTSGFSLFFFFFLDLSYSTLNRHSVVQILLSHALWNQRKYTWPALAVFAFSLWSEAESAVSQRGTCILWTLSTYSAMKRITQ